ncbi:MAG: methyltransferase domain-containing protein [Dokdonella sp.]
MTSAAGPMHPANLPREVRPEWLDTLAPDEPRARRSRADLRRINWIMGALGTLRGALDPFLAGGLPIRLVEIGAGDGSLMARLAHQCGARWPSLHVSLLDLQPVVAPTTQAAIERRGWTVEVLRCDVFAWLREAPQQPNEIIVANLFVHHFDNAQIGTLLAAIAARAEGFVCCEPRRSRLALLGSHGLGALGCNDVTRHDAVASVHAGFRDQELSGQWPSCPGWITDEAAAGFFLHCFVARRTGAT